MENKMDNIPNTLDNTNTELTVGLKQHIGNREEQQDSFGSCLGDEVKGSLFIVADGMGGMAHGSTASKFAVSFATEIFERQESMTDTPDFLLKLMQALNQKVVAFAEQKNMPGSVGTTVVCVVIKENNLHWVSIGDSRIYLFKNNYLLQLSYDHIYENQLKQKVANQEISLTEALNNREKDYLTSYIGAGQLNEIDYNIKPLILEKGDKIVLCSDGIYNVLSELEFYQHLEKAPQQACDDMVNTILEKSFKSQDNMSVMIIEYKGEQDDV